MKSGINRPWTKDEQQLLLELRAQGLTLEAEAMQAQEDMRALREAHREWAMRQRRALPIWAWATERAEEDAG